MRSGTNFGDDWAPKRLTFASGAPAHPQEYLDYFRCPVAYEQPEARFVLSTAAWEAPLPASDANLFRLMDEHARMLMDQKPRPDDIVGLTQNEIMRALRGDDLAVEVGAGWEAVVEADWGGVGIGRRGVAPR